MANIHRMITKLYEKLNLKPNKTVKETKIYLRQFFNYSYTKEGTFKEFTPFELKQRNLNDLLAKKTV